MSDGNYLYYAGGGWESDPAYSTLYAYDPGADAWSTLAVMPATVGSIDAVYAGGKIYVHGGDSGFGSLTNVLYIYDIGTNTWSTGADVPTGRSTEGYAATYLEGFGVYKIGGWIPSIGNQPYVDLYDIAGNTWTSKADMETARWQPAIWAFEGSLYAAGGNDADYSRTSMASKYNPIINIWTDGTISDLPEAYDLAGHAVAYDAGNNGLLYFIGGRSLDWDAINSVLVYSTSTDAWTNADALPAVRAGVKAACLNGYIYAVGGGTDWGDAEGNTWRLSIDGRCESITTTTTPTTSTTTTTTTTPTTSTTTTTGGADDDSTVDDDTTPVEDDTTADDDDAADDITDDDTATGDYITATGGGVSSVGGCCG